jgi:energy-coupling factor transporter transmembrane protein EcfT
MSYRKLFWGVLLVIIGVLFILKNMGVIWFDWWTILHLWPLILILWGISLIPMKDYVKLILSLVAIALTFLIVSKYDNSDRPFMNWHRNHHNWQFNIDDSDEDSTYNSETQELYQSYDSTFKTASLNFEAAAGDFTIADSLLTDKLLLFRKKGNIGDYSMTSSDEGDKRIVNLKIKDTNVKFKNNSNEVEMYLNPEPAWDFKFDVGAANINFDLSKFKIGNLQLDGGASSMYLKLGSKLPESKVKVNAGAASINIDVPQNAGVEIRTETVLTSHDFEGFKKVSKGHYRTDNFNSSTNKIFIEVDAGVSSLEVTRYE